MKSVNSVQELVDALVIYTAELHPCHPVVLLHLAPAACCQCCCAEGRSHNKQLPARSILHASTSSTALMPQHILLT